MRRDTVYMDELAKFKSYFYLHVNGDLISKPAIVVRSDPEYFVSDFVQGWWGISDDDDWTTMAHELTELGINIPDRV